MEFEQRDLDMALIRDLLRRRDPIGYLSVYADADPVIQSRSRPAWQIEVANGLREVRQRSEDAPREEGMTLQTALAEAERRLEYALAASAAGRGRAWFIPVSGGDAVAVAVQSGWDTIVRLEPTPHVWPLLRALEQDGPVGIVAVSADGIRVLERAFGTAEDLLAIDVAPDEADWRRMQGPAAANPAMAQQSAPQHDRYRRRDRTVRQQDLAEYALEVADLGRRRGWGFALVAGDPRFAEAVRGSLEGNHVAIIALDRILTGAPQAIDEAVADEIEGARRAARGDLARRVVETAAAAGPAVTDLASLRAALDEGRIHHLVVDPAGVADGGDRPGEVEDLIERALGSGAEVTLVDHGELGTPAGVGALLRW